MATPTSDRKQINRAQLERLKEKLLEPVRTTPPTLGTYPREIDIELFQLFSIGEVQPVRREKLVTLGGREVRSARDAWVYEVPGCWDVEVKERNGEGALHLHREYVLFGEVQENGTFVAIPDVREFPYFTSKTDNALDLKHSVLGFGRTLVIEEVEDEFVSHWRAKIMVSDRVVAQGKTYDSASAVVVAVLSDLIANDGASWWIDVVDTENIGPALHP